MILLDRDIRRGLEQGHIVIEPFCEEHLGPNSYDVRLGEELLIYERDNDGILDMRAKNRTKAERIPDAGKILWPGTLYLGVTMEKIGTTGLYVPHLEGRSSIGRLGMGVHVTAGFGDCGYHGHWTLEITVVHPLRVYAGTRIAQAYFMAGLSDMPEKLYRGKYGAESSPVASLLLQDYENRSS